MVRIIKESEDHSLTYCPVCGSDRFNDKTGLCIDCGYDEKHYGDISYYDEDVTSYAKDSTDSELIKRAEKALNYRLGRGEDYVTVDDAEVVGKTDSGKNIVRVSYSVRVHIPVWTDPETGITEYEDDYEYRTDDIVI